MNQVRMSDFIELQICSITLPPGGGARDSGKPRGPRRFAPESKPVSESVQ